MMEIYLTDKGFGLLEAWDFEDADGAPESAASDE